MNYYLMSYFAIYFGQAIGSIGLNLPGSYIMLMSITDELYASDVIALIVWTMGFVIEVAADRQLARFRENPPQG